MARPPATSVVVTGADRTCSASAYDISTQDCDARRPSDPQLARCHLGPLDACPDLREGRVTRGRRVVAERGEAAVVGGAEMLRVNEAHGLQDAIADLFGGLDARVDRIRDADVDPPIARRERTEDPQFALVVRL